MYEDWELAAGTDGTTLTKSWRDVELTSDPGFPHIGWARDPGRTRVVPGRNEPVWV